jgi:hypothetical protein
MAYDIVNPTKYAKQLTRARNFIKLCALPEGQVFNTCRIDDTLGETLDAEGHYHFRLANTAVALLAGA